MGHNQISSIGAHAFPASLFYLHLNHNQISSIGAHAFPASLYSLYLDHNQIASIGSHAFPASLYSLHLEHNQITSIGAHAFPFSLAFLYLDHNQISLVHFDAFFNLTQLIFLDLSHNKIIYLPGSIFATIGTTTYWFHSLKVDLSYNEMCTLDPDLFLDSPIIWSLNLDNNKISCLPPKVFSKTEMVEISLTSNEITVISPDTIAAVVSLDYHGYQHQGFGPMGIKIYLSGNKITYIPADILSEITSGSNYIVEAIVDLLDLSDNLITFIDPDAFREKTATKLILSNNLLTCLPEGLFINFIVGNCKSYSCAYFTNHLNLENNQLPTVHPAAFFGANWTDVPNFQMDDYYGPGLTIYLESNPLICSTICWMHHAEASLGPVDCADGIDWDNWDGFDSNGQCFVPPKPVCPVPSSIPVSPNQCPTGCSGK